MQLAEDMLIDGPHSTPSQTPDKTEHGAFFVDYVLPAQYSRFDIRTWLVPNQEASVISRITDLFSRTKTHGLKVVNVDPTPKDGGVFVNFTYNPPPDASGTKTLEEVEKSIRAEVEKAGGIRTWFGIGTGDFFRVKGKPWNEVRSSSACCIEGRRLTSMNSRT